MESSQRPPEGPDGDPTGPQSPAPGPPDTGPQSPAPAGPPAPGAPPPPAVPAPQSPAPAGQPPSPTYGGPVPPGGWSQPTAPAAGYGPLASWGSRLGAYLIDGLILAIPAIGLFVALVGGAVGISGDDEDVAAGAVIGALLLWFLVMAVVFLLYAPLLMMRQGERNGQTVGKQLLGLRVVRTNGQPVNFGSAALREVVMKFLAVFIASSIIPLIPWFLNFFWPLWDDENRALHDMAASTRVVRA